VASAGPVKQAPRFRQITMPAPYHSVFTGRMPFLPPNQQRQSTEGICLLLVVYYFIRTTMTHWLVQCAVVISIMYVTLDWYLRSVSLHACLPGIWVCLIHEGCPFAKLPWTFLLCWSRRYEIELGLHFWNIPLYVQRFMVNGEIDVSQVASNWCWIGQVKCSRRGIRSVS